MHTVPTQGITRALKFNKADGSKYVDVKWVINDESGVSRGEILLLNMKFYQSGSIVKYAWNITTVGTGGEAHHESISFKLKKGGVQINDLTIFDYLKFWTKQQKSFEGNESTTVVDLKDVDSVYLELQGGMWGYERKS